MGLVQSKKTASDPAIVRKEGFGFCVDEDARGLIDQHNHVVVCFGYGKFSEETELLVLREDYFLDWAAAVSYPTEETDEW
jgi:hypothetical protein